MQSVTYLLRVAATLLSLCMTNRRREKLGDRMEVLSVFGLRWCVCVCVRAAFVTVVIVVFVGRRSE